MRIYKSPEDNRKAERLSNGFWTTSALSSVLTVGVSSFTNIDEDATLFLIGAMLLNVGLSLFFLIAGIKLKRESWDAEKQAAQQKYDAEDRAMFGKPLREIEL